MIEVSRRALFQALGISIAGAPVFVRSATVLAADMDKVTIGWPSDVPPWDPEQRTVPDAQPIYKLVFDQPLDQGPDLKLVPKLVKAWNLAPDALSLSLDFRDDVKFHDGTPMTSADFKYSFFDRVKAGDKIDVAQVWGFVTDVDTPSPTQATMHFKLPFATSAEWLAFLCSFVVPKAYIEKVGEDGFVKAPIGTGPYKLVEYELNSRIVLERNEAYWGPKPKMKNVTFQIIKDPSARVAAIQSGQIDLTLNVPVREAERFMKDANFKAELNPIQRVIIIQTRGDLAFADKNVRLAAHHAIDKAALSKAFYAGAAVPLSVVAPPGTPGFVEGYTFAYDPELSKKLLAESGFSTSKPVKIGLATTNGQFPSDYDMARAIAQMWKAVGINATIEETTIAKLLDAAQNSKLAGPVLYSWANGTGDPENYAGRIFDPRLRFSAWKDMSLSSRIDRLMTEVNEQERMAGYKALNVESSEKSWAIPLLQGITTVAYSSALQPTLFDNGYVLPVEMKYK
jgi:peptide/nickel transport system substrate-binding protein